MQSVDSICLFPYSLEAYSLFAIALWYPVGMLWINTVRFA